MLLLVCCSGGAKPVGLDRFFISEGIALTRDMQDLAKSKEYVALMSPSESITQIMDTVASEDYGLPQNAYLITLSEDFLQRILRAYSGGKTIPGDVMEKLKQKFNGSVFASILNASHGSEIIAATSLITWGKSYIKPQGWSGNSILLLEYSGQFSSIVSFMQSGDGVISASSVFVQNNSQSVFTWFQSALSLSDNEYKRYTVDEIQELMAK